MSSVTPRCRRSKATVSAPPSCNDSRHQRIVNSGNNDNTYNIDDNSNVNNDSSNKAVFPFTNSPSSLSGDPSFAISNQGSSFVPN